jgi:hypothetical protein
VCVSAGIAVGVWVAVGCCVGVASSAVVGVGVAGGAAVGVGGRDVKVGNTGNVVDVGTTAGTGCRGRPCSNAQPPMQ